MVYSNWLMNFDVFEGILMVVRFRSLDDPECDGERRSFRTQCDRDQEGPMIGT